MKTGFLILAVCLLGTYVPCWGQSDGPIVLPPLVDEGIEVVLLISPGAYINYATYQPLGIAMQQASPYRLWVGLIGPFTADVPTASGCSEHIDEALAMMTAQGMRSDYLFVAGHSLGGVVMQTWIRNNLSNTTGTILLASEISAFLDGFDDYPIMQISGDLDGIVLIFELQNIFREYEVAASSDPSLMYKRPITVLTDVNHMAFASGDPPVAVEDHDILSPLSEEEGHAVLARHMDAFMAVNIGVSSGNHLAESKTLMEHDFSSTKDIFRPLQEMNRVTQSIAGNFSMYSPWAEEAQMIVSALMPDSANLLQVEDTSYFELDTFEGSRPSISVEDGVGLAQTTSLLTYYGKEDIQEPILAPQELAVKMKQREAVDELLSPLGAVFTNFTRNCFDVNQAAVDIALSSVSDTVWQRWTQRAKPLILLDDLSLDTGLNWVNSKVFYNFTDAGLEVQSTSLITGLDAPFGLDGMHYCKLMPPIRALEYIMVDSLRRTQP